MSFALGGVAAGGSAVVSILNLNTATITGYSEYGPTADNPANHWYAFPYDNASNTGMVILGNEILLHLTDGGRGDTDGATNGLITSVGGPTVASSQVTGVLTPSSHPDTYGQPLNLTYTVTPTVAGGPAPTGTVTFNTYGGGTTTWSGASYTVVNGRWWRR